MAGVDDFHAGEDEGGEAGEEGANTGDPDAEEGEGAAFPVLPGRGGLGLAAVGAGGFVERVALAAGRADGHMGMIGDCGGWGKEAKVGGGQREAGSGQQWALWAV